VLTRQSHAAKRFKRKCQQKTIKMMSNTKQTTIEKNNHRGGVTQAMVTGFLSGVVCSKYEVKMIWRKGNDIKVRYKVPGSFAPEWTKQDILTNIQYLAEHNLKNQENYNVYIRPLDDRFVLLDDLNRDKLKSLAELRPCLLMETSQGNYQAWLKLRNMPQERAHQTQIWKRLAAMFDADPGSAKPDQIGRLPGFYNVKEKYAPDFPMVKLHRYQDRFSIWTPDRISENLTDIPTGSVSNPPPVVKMKSGTDRSGFDWAVTCSLIEKGWTDDQIRRHLEQYSHKAATRRDDYIGRTIANARRTLKIH
jgi:hypothetical protein